MDSLIRKLQQELQRQPDIQIQQSASWGLPVELVNVSYTTIKRTTMDILMKMILLTIQKLEISDSARIAAFLAVEPLFVEGLFDKMQNALMIEKRSGRFALTAIGVSQLQSGVYEHPPEEAQKKFYYSASHDAVLCQEPEKVLTSKVKAFRLANQQTSEVLTIDREKLHAALLSAGAEKAEGSLQAVIHTIELPEVLEKRLIPCVEFYVFNRAEALYFTRVWNTLTEQWDERLEKMLNEQSPLQK